MLSMHGDSFSLPKVVVYSCSKTFLKNSLQFITHLRTVAVFLFSLSQPLTRKLYPCATFPSPTNLSKSLWMIPIFEANANGQVVADPMKFISGDSLKFENFMAFCGLYYKQGGGNRACSILGWSWGKEICSQTRIGPQTVCYFFCKFMSRWRTSTQLNDGVFLVQIACGLEMLMCPAVGNIPEKLHKLWGLGIYDRLGVGPQDGSFARVILRKWSCSEKLVVWSKFTFPPYSHVARFSCDGFVSVFFALASFFLVSLHVWTFSLVSHPKSPTWLGS